MFLINMNAEIVACILSFRKSRHKPNLESTSKYGFSPDLGEKWRRSEHAHASYPGLFFRPPGLSPYMIWGGKKGEFRDWTRYRRESGYFLVLTRVTDILYCDVACTLRAAKKYGNGEWLWNNFFF